MMETAPVPTKPTVTEVQTHFAELGAKLLGLISVVVTITGAYYSLAGRLEVFKTRYEADTKALNKRLDRIDESIRGVYDLNSKVTLIEKDVVGNAEDIEDLKKHRR
jgi:hypothetical protein